jgi:hypothetical protein
LAQFPEILKLWDLMSHSADPLSANVRPPFEPGPPFSSKPKASVNEADQAGTIEI